MAAHVVAGADGSPSANAAVVWAAEDAARRGCALRIAHASEPWAADVRLRRPADLPESLAGQSRIVLDAAVDLARERVPGLTVEGVLEVGRPVEVLRREAGGAEQLVVGSRGRGGFAGLLLGSVSLALAGHGSVPTVVVRGETGRVAGEIVAGFDGSAESEAALAYAFQEAERRGAALRAIHAWELPVFAASVTPYALLVEDMLASQRRLASELLAPWRERYPRVEVEEAVVYGHPVRVLCDVAATSDLLVVGSRGLGALGSAVLGSVSHGVLHHAECPVAVVPTSGKA